MKNPLMDPHHQMARMTGCVKLQRNLRVSPFVIDPFAIRKVDAVLSTHTHNDHIDINVAAAVLKNCPNTVPFIGPQSSTDVWLKWGVPRERITTVRPGDVVKVPVPHHRSMQMLVPPSVLTQMPVQASHHMAKVPALTTSASISSLSHVPHCGKVLSTHDSLVTSSTLAMSCSSFSPLKRSICSTIAR